MVATAPLPTSSNQFASLPITVRQCLSMTRDPLLLRPECSLNRLWRTSHQRCNTIGELPACRHLVGIAQSVEHLVVVQGVAGSSPVTHPKWERFKPSTRVTTLCPV